MVSGKRKPLSGASAKEVSIMLTEDEEFELLSLERERVGKEPPANSPKQKKPAWQQMNETLDPGRTLGRAIRSGAAGIASLPDIGLLVPKTAAIATGMGLEELGAETAGQALQKLGTTPTLAETSKNIIDKATGGSLKPRGTQDKVFDLIGEVIASGVPFTKTPVGAYALTNFTNPNNPSGVQAISAALNPLEALEQNLVSKVNPSSILPFQKPKPKMTSDQLKKQASSSYQKAEGLGGILKPEVTNKFIDDVSREVLPQSQAGKILAGDSQVTKVVERLQSLRDQPLTLQASQEIDEILGDFVDSEYTVTGLSKQGKKILDIQDVFRNTIENVDENMVSGDAGRKGFESIKKGREQWAKAARLRDIERIVSRAEMSDQPANAIRSGFKTLYNNPSRMRGFNKQEKEMIRKMAQESLPMEALRGLASRLTGIISGSVHGPAGYAVGKTIEMGARGVRESSKMRRVDELTDYIVNGKQVKTQVSPNKGKAAISGTSNVMQKMRDNKK